jgi:kynurenine formamidase
MGMTMTGRERSQAGRRVDVTGPEFQEIFDDVSTWGRWQDGQRGALNHLTPARIAAAARLVRTGVTVPLGRVLDTRESVVNHVPADHHMTMLTDTDVGSGSVRFAKDYIGVDYHNEEHSHLDALSHVAYRGHFYDGAPESAVTAEGASTGVVEELRNGLVGRGVLLDIPRVRGVRWLEPGEYVQPEDLTAAERDQGVRVGEGDILLVRTGHWRRLAELGPWDTVKEKAGLHPRVARFLAEREVAALGSDGNSDTAPSAVEGVGYPIHVLAINAMGIPLLDYLQFEDLLPRCDDAHRWEFLLVACPLRIAGGTGSPVNPIAVL